MTEPRWKDIAAIREQIAQGTYCTEGKLKAVADRLVEELVLTPTLNDERAKEGSELCWIMAKLKPCTRKGVETVWWSYFYPKIKACKQHAKQVRGE